MSAESERVRRLEVGPHEKSFDGDVEVYEFAVRVPEGLRWFEGHFVGNPVLPAMVQLWEALLLVTGVWPDLESLRGVTRAKFRRPIRPGDELRVRFRRTPGAARASFEYRRQQESCSSGVLEFAKSKGQSS